MGIWSFRLFVLISMLLTTAQAALGFNFDKIIFDEANWQVEGASVFVVSAAGIVFALAMLLHVTLFFFWGLARYIFAGAVLVWIPAAYSGRLPGTPEMMEPLYLGTMIATGVISGIIIALAFSGKVGARFAGRNSEEA
jgi:hypothetical protein